MTSFTAGDILALDHAMTLRAVDVSGAAAAARRAGTGGPARDAAPRIGQDGLASAGVDPGAAAELARAITGAGLRLEGAVELPALSPASGTTERPVAPGAATARLELELEAPPTDEGQVLLEVDGTGYVRWHFPSPPGDAEGATRSGGRQGFVVPVDQFAVSPSEDGREERGLLGFGIRKVLSVLRFPIETAAGWMASTSVATWEDRFRPYRLSFSGPDGSLTGTADPARIAQLADGPFLALVHGTFSQGTPTFARLFADRDLFRTLHTRYGGRVLVFDHPSVHVTPAANAAWLRAQLPTDRAVELHVLAHSRGGLVARHLAADPVPVGTLVHVAVPNAGTILASRENLGALLDTYTNLLALLPDTSGTPALQVVLEVVKQVAQGALGGLEGLAAMDPASPALTELNRRAAAPTSRILAVATDYEPPPSVALAERALDRLADAMFRTGNDLVVPTDGVAQAGRYQAAEVHLAGAGGGTAITHNTYFADAAVRRRLADWLTA